MIEGVALFESFWWPLSSHELKGSLPACCLKDELLPQFVVPLRYPELVVFQPHCLPLLLKCPSFAFKTALKEDANCSFLVTKLLMAVVYAWRLKFGLFPSTVMLIKYVLIISGSFLGFFCIHSETTYIDHTSSHL